MAISPWVPAAVELGSLAFSGIGSWLSSRDQRKYQEDIRRMQEDARKRVADAQKIANQRANYFSIMTKQRVAPDPVNLDLPVIPAYDPGNWTKLMSGLGKGLGYAAKGASAFHTAQTYSEKLAAEAGKQAAQRDAWEAKQTADVTGQFKPYSTYNTKGEDTFTPVDTSRSYLDHLGNLTDEKAYEKAQADGSVFSGLFSGDSDKSFKASYASTLMDAHNKADTLHRTNVYQEAQLNLSRKKLEAQQRESRLATAGRLAIQQQNAAQWEVSIMQDFRKEIVGPDFRDRIRRIDKFDEALNLVKQSTGEPFLLHKETGKRILDPKGNEIPNPDYGISFDKNGRVNGVRITGGVADALMQVYQRTRDEGVVHAGDVDRIQGSMNTFWGSLGAHTFEDWYRRLGTDDESPITLTPQQTFQLVKILETDRKFIFESMGTEAVAIATSTANSISAYSDGGLFQGWKSTKELLENLTGVINDQLDPHRSPDFISDVEADYITRLDSQQVHATLTAGLLGEEDDLSDIVPDVVKGKAPYYLSNLSPEEYEQNIQDAYWNDYAGQGTVIAEAAKLGGRSLEAIDAVVTDALENFTLENLYKAPRIIRDALPGVEGTFLKKDFQNPNQNPNAGWGDYAAYYGGRGAETLIAAPFKTVQDAVARSIGTGHAINTTIGSYKREPIIDAEAAVKATAQAAKFVGSALVPSIEPLQDSYDYGRDLYNTGDTYLRAILTDPALWALIAGGRNPSIGRGAIFRGSRPWQLPPRSNAGLPSSSLPLPGIGGQ